MFKKIKQIIAEWKRQRELERQLDEALIDPTFLDRASGQASR